MIPEAKPARARSLSTMGCGREPMTEHIVPAFSETDGGKALPLLLGGGMAVGISVPALVKAVSTYEIRGLGRVTSGTRRPSAASASASPVAISGTSPPRSRPGAASLGQTGASRRSSRSSCSVPPSRSRRSRARAG